MKTLYVTAGKTLYKVRTDIAGMPRLAMRTASGAAIACRRWPAVVSVRHRPRAG